MNSPKNILVITYWSYNDALIQTYTLPYLRLISKQLPENSRIFLLTLDKKTPDSVSMPEDINIENISIAYKPFGLSGVQMWIKVLYTMIRIIRKRKISVIHTWCTPAGGMGYILSVLTGKKLILDSFEPHAIPMLEGNTWRKKSIAFKILFWLEQKQLNRADEVICAVSGMVPYSKTVYKIEKKRYFVKPACVNLDLFSSLNLKKNDLLNELGLNNSIVCVYAGKFGGLYLENETFNFFAAAYRYWGNKFKILLLTNHSAAEIQAYSAKAGLPLNVIVQRFVPHHLIPDYLGLADFAVCPMKPLPSRRYSTPIKDGEYWALGLPVVITKDISDDSDIIREHNIGSVLEELNEESYAKSIKQIDELLKNNTRAELYEKIRPIAEKYRNFKIAEKVYNEIYRNNG